MKIGDVNGTAAPHSLMGTEVRNGSTGLILEVQDRVFHKGDGSSEIWIRQTSKV